MAVPADLVEGAVLRVESSANYISMAEYGRSVHLERKYPLTPLGP